jgi:hypothetical protein
MKMSIKDIVPNYWRASGRREPYTSIGIKRLRCVRCGGKAAHQWQVCADGNVYRPLCLCDIALNKLVLEWANDPQAAEKTARYQQQAQA